MTNEGAAAVFVSHASQDATAVLRMAEVLRAAGVEGWFDQNELVGGDARDQRIRKQIKDCALFVPIISASTQARNEGYFRLEWRRADQRKCRTLSPKSNGRARPAAKRRRRFARG